MKHFYSQYKALFCLCLLLTACQPSSAGPTAWIDQPLDNSSLPFAPVIIQAHASDADGISAFEFYIGEQKFSEVTAGGKNFEEASVEWQPSSPGEFTLIVRVLDKAGNLGPSAIAKVFIGRANNQTPTSTPPSELPAATPTMTPLFNLTPTETVLIPIPSPATLTPTFPGCRLTLNSNANCRQGPSTAFAVWDILTQGESVQALGRNQDSGWLYIQNPTSGKQCWLAYSTIRAQCDISSLAVIQAPPTLTVSPSSTQTLPPPPAADTQSPEVSISSLNPEQIVVKSDSCVNYPQTTIVSVQASDPSGIAWVQASWKIGSEQGNLIATHLGGIDYQVTIGPVNSSGSLTITIVAQDAAGNAGSSVASVNVLPCPE